MLLMNTDKGVILKTIRSITPGEPLLMWFTENILAMMNMPFLTPSNIQGKTPIKGSLIPEKTLKYPGENTYCETVEDS